MEYLMESTVIMKDCGKMGFHMVKESISLMTHQNIKVSLLMVNHMVGEDLQMICFVMRGFFIKECSMAKVWYSTSLDKHLKECSSKIVCWLGHINMPMVTSIKVSLSKIRNQVKVSINSLMEITIKAHLRKAREVVMV